MDLESYIKRLNKRRIRSGYRTFPVNIIPILTKFHNINAVLFDVYGTIIKGKSNSIADLEKDKQGTKAFHNTLKEFKFQNSLKEIGREKYPAELLKKLYLEEIKKYHTVKRKNGIKYPEVKIERIWNSIINLLMRNGYNYNKKIFGNPNEFSLKVSYFHQYANEGHDFYKNAFYVLKNLKNCGVKLGLVSNAQFYTPINLEIELRKQSKNKIGLYDIFDKDLISFSYKVGQGKPSIKIFEKILKNLKKKKIKESNTVFIGNDANKDIEPSKNVGFKTVLFSGDKDTLRPNAKIKPDAIIKDWLQLLKIIS